MNNIRISVIIFLVVIGVFSVSGLGQRVPEVLFQSDQILEIKLLLNFSSLEKTGSGNLEFSLAQVSYQDSNHQVVTINIELSPRGNSRRDTSICHFPPLLLKFKKKEVKGTIFEGQKRLKLVTHCRTQPEDSQQYTIKEYLVYRMYNIISHQSFRVRLVRITYEDIEKKNPSFSRYGFFIEDEDDMAVRLNAIIDKTALKYSVFQQKDAQITLEVFQYLIGNTDWSIPGRHNIKIIKAGSDQALYAVPYDFDMSGIVNAKYAVPNEKIRNKIKNVRQRLFRGLCRKPEEFLNTFRHFSNQKESLIQLCDSCEFLDPKHKSEMIDYINEFYKIITNDSSVRKNLVETCL